MNGNKFGSPEERAKIELLDSFFKRFGKEFREALGEVKLDVSEYEWGDWYYFSLSNARTNEVLQLPREANCIVRVELIGNATMKFDSPNGREVDLVKTRKLKGFTFKRIYISNDAISGGHLLLLIGKGDFDIEFEKASLGEINNYNILDIDLYVKRSDQEYEVNARALQLLEKPSDDWSIKLNSTENDSIDGSYIDPGDIIQGDGAMPAYIKKIYFTNPSSYGSVKFLCSRDLPFRSLTESEEYLEVDPESDPTYPTPVGWPSFTAENWELQQDLGEEQTQEVIWDYFAVFGNIGGGNAILAHLSRHVWKTEDYGATWERISTIPLSGGGELKNISKLVNLGSPNEWGIIIGASAGSSNYAPTYAKSSDYGQSWTGYNAGGYDYDIHGSKPLDCIYIGNNIVLASYTTISHGTKLCRSTNKGVNWTVTSFPTSGWFVNLGSGVVLLCGENKSIYRSSDWGENWTEISTIPQIPYRVTYLGNNVVIIGCTNGDIYKSEDGGYNWEYKGTLISQVNWLEPYGSGKVLALCSNGTLYKSEDYGETWTALGKPSGIVGGYYQGYSLKVLAEGVVVGFFGNSQIYRVSSL